MRRCVASRRQCDGNAGNASARGRGGSRTVRADTDTCWRCFHGPADATLVESEAVEGDLGRPTCEDRFLLLTSARSTRTCSSVRFLECKGGTDTRPRQNKPAQKSQTVSMSPEPVTSTAIPGKPWISACGRQSVSWSASQSLCERSKEREESEQRTGRLPPDADPVPRPVRGRAVEDHGPVVCAVPQVELRLDWCARTRSSGGGAPRAASRTAAEELPQGLPPLLDAEPLGVRARTEQHAPRARRPPKLHLSGEVRVEDDFDEAVRRRRGGGGGGEEEGEA